MYSYGPPHMAVQKQDDQHEHTFSSYVRIRDVVLKTCQKRWMIGRSGERGSGITVLAARHDDDDDDDICNIMAEGCRLMPFGLVRLRTFQLSAYLRATLIQVFTRTRGRSGRVTQKCHNGPDGKRGYIVRVTSRTGSARRIGGDFEKVSS